MSKAGFVAGVVAGLVAAAVGQELAKEPTERTWRGKVAGVPYNFHLASWGEIASEYWNPQDNHIFTPHVIGMGWGINFAAVANRVRELSQMNETNEPEAQPLPEPRQISESVER